MLLGTPPRREFPVYKKACFVEAPGGFSTALDYPQRRWNAIGNKWQLVRVCSPRANEEEATKPVLIMWAVPAVIVIGGVGYYLVRAVH
jgi:hypothetical protein